MRQDARLDTKVIEIRSMPDVYAQFSHWNFSNFLRILSGDQMFKWRLGFGGQMLGTPGLSSNLLRCGLSGRSISTIPCEH